MLSEISMEHETKAGREALTEAELAVTAEMARLRLTAVERARLRAGVQQILQYFDLMAAVDISGVEPTIHALQTRNRLRPDRVTPAEVRWPGADSDRLLAAAPQRADDHFSVPNVL